MPLTSSKTDLIRTVSRFSVNQKKKNNSKLQVTSKLIQNSTTENWQLPSGLLLRGWLLRTILWFSEKLYFSSKNLFHNVGCSKRLLEDLQNQLCQVNSQKTPSVTHTLYELWVPPECYTERAKNSFKEVNITVSMSEATSISSGVP